jgi:PAS domain-containing protein
MRERRTRRKPEPTARAIHETELLARTRALLLTGQAIREIAELKRTVEDKIVERTESLKSALHRQSALLAEAELARIEFEVALNAMSDGLVLTDADGRIKRANDKALLLFNRRELVGGTCAELLADGAACPHHLLSAACAAAAAEHLGRRPDLRLQIRVHRIANAKGILIGFTHVLRDLTGEQRDEALGTPRAASVDAGRITR